MIGLRLCGLFIPVRFTGRNVERVALRHVKLDQLIAFLRAFLAVVFVVGVNAGIPGVHDVRDVAFDLGNLDGVG